MDKDTIIAVVLGIIVMMLVFALGGVIAATGYFYMSNAGPQEPGKPVVPVEKPIVDTVSPDQNALADVNAAADLNKTPDSNAPAVVKAPEPAAVCGNSKKETGEQCEVAADCTSEQVCTACKCVAKPAPTNVKLDKISVTGVTYWCYRPAYNGKNGLGIKIISIKNTGTSDFTIKGENTIKATAGETADEVKTKATTNIVIKPGQTQGIYGSDISRDAPYLFLGNKVNVPLSVNIDYGDHTYSDYSSTLASKDSTDAGCQ